MCRGYKTKPPRILKVAIKGDEWSISLAGPLAATKFTSNPSFH
jgi:hypothetical protein